MTNLTNYFRLKAAYWYSLDTMQRNIENNWFELAMTRYLFSLVYADEIWDHLGKLTDEEKRYIFIL